MKIQIEGKEYIVPGCFQVVDGQKKVACVLACRCNLSKDCIWAEEGKRAEHVVEVPVVRNNRHLYNG